MKVLVVCSKNKGFVKSFIKEQSESLKTKRITIDYYSVEGKGILGYLKNFKNLKRKINDFLPDIIHAHYGLSGLLANLQRAVPVVVTYHGSDINLTLPRFFSRFSILLSSRNIFVSNNLSDRVGLKNPLIIPCGINLDIFKPIDKKCARLRMKLDLTKTYILFSSSFDNPVKNYKLAKQAIDLLCEFDIEIIELKGFERYEVSNLLNSVDLALMTSYTEGSPQFIKESMACNTPIVSVDVGEVRKIINKAANCYVSKSHDPVELASYIKKIILSGEKSDGRDYIKDYEESFIADKIVEVYNSLI